MKAIGRLTIAVALLGAIAFCVCFAAASESGDDSLGAGAGTLGGGGAAGPAPPAGPDAPVTGNAGGPPEAPRSGGPFKTAAKVAVALAAAAAAAYGISRLFPRKPSAPEVPKTELQDVPADEDIEDNEERF